MHPLRPPLPPPQRHGVVKPGRHEVLVEQDEAGGGDHPRGADGRGRRLRKKRGGEGSLVGLGPLPAPSPDWRSPSASVGGVPRRLQPPPIPHPIRTAPAAAAAPPFLPPASRPGDRRLPGEPRASELRRATGERPRRSIAPKARRAAPVGSGRATGRACGRGQVGGGGGVWGQRGRSAADPRQRTAPGAQLPRQRARPDLKMLLRGAPARAGAMARTRAGAVAPPSSPAPRRAQSARSAARTNLLARATAPSGARARRGGPVAAAAPSAAPPTVRSPVVGQGRESGELAGDRGRQCGVLTRPARADGRARPTLSSARRARGRRPRRPRPHPGPRPGRRHRGVRLCQESAHP